MEEVLAVADAICANPLAVKQAKKSMNVSWTWTGKRLTVLPWKRTTVW